MSAIILKYCREPSWVSEFGLCVMLRGNAGRIFHFRLEIDEHYVLINLVAVHHPEQLEVSRAGTFGALVLS